MSRSTLNRRNAIATCIAGAALFEPTAQAWWDTGHSFITINTYQQLPPAMQPYFLENQGTITLYAKNEPPGLHFIDIDAYSEFHDDGTFPRDLNVLYANYGTSVVNGRGISPWSIANYRTSLTSKMATARTLAAWQALAQTAGEMAHYIEDIHQPLHCTQNYDGQFTGNSGVHARYEGEMINRHFDGLTIAYAPQNTVYVADTVDRVLNSIDVTWQYVSPIMTADTLAAGTPRTFGAAYYDSMWASTGSFTHSQFQLASQMVASLWYSAWVDAGSPTPIVAEPVWMTNADGNWSAAASWLSNVPGGIDAAAKLGATIKLPRTVTLDSPQTLGSLKFDNANRYTLAGPGTLSIQTSLGGGSINVLNGSHTIAAPVQLMSPTTVTVTNAADKLTFSGDLTGGAGITLTKQGLGKLELKNLRVGTADIEAGSITVLPNPTANDPSGVSRVKSLVFAGSGTPVTTLDLTNNALVCDYSTTTPIAAMRSFINKGFHNGAWDSTGITSSSAASVAADSSNSHKTAIGYGEASTLGISSFFGQSVDSTTVLLMYTFSGDANLDGAVNALDFGALASNFGSATGKLWMQADFNYDGISNSLDFAALAANFGMSGGVASAFSQGLVPEPAAVGVLGILVLVRRRRSAYGAG